MVVFSRCLVEVPIVARLGAPGTHVSVHLPHPLAHLPHTTGAAHQH